MKHRLLILILLISTAAAFADGPKKRTVVIKDGKVVSNQVNGIEVMELDDFQSLLGKRAHLGVRLTDLSAELREHYGAPKDAGLLVASVENGSPAEKAGIRVGDIVLSIDGQDVDSAVELRRGLRDKKDGDSVRIEVLRNRARQTLVATVVEREPTRFVLPRNIEGLRGIEGLRELDSPEWRARIQSIGDCQGLQSRIKELESRLKDLEKKLQK
ncbi:MAG TPA: PDZ domain-containing protein [Thermoanaerobaculia bacterium]|nr:PDZ domain-containing protein [Thermoanaerobaculia bacterium]